MLEENVVEGGKVWWFDQLLVIGPIQGLQGFVFKAIDNRTNERMSGTVNKGERENNGRISKGDVSAGKAQADLYTRWLQVSRAAALF